jgi:PPIC-type PPIASE domain
MIARKFSLEVTIYLVLLFRPLSLLAFGGSQWNRIERDLQALTRRVTARHILLPPSMEVALTLKQRIRTQCLDDNRFVVDVFSEAAKKYSQDESTNFRGGLIGELVPQGYCRCPELDRACFEVRLGQIEGPIESPFGYHLLLVTERTNCPKIDGTKSKLVPDPDRSGMGKLVESEQKGSINVAKFVREQTFFWLFVCIAGEALAELTAQVGSDNFSFL